MRVVHPLAVVLAAGALVTAGCAGRTAANPNPEPAARQHAEVPLPTPPLIIPNARIVDDSNAVRHLPTRRSSSGDQSHQAPGVEADSILSASARSDASPMVRGVAVAAYLRVAGDTALPLAREVMASPSWRNVLRTPAITVLKGMHGAAAQALYHEYVK